MTVEMNLIELAALFVFAIRGGIAFWKEVK